MYSHFTSYLGICSTEEDQIPNGATLHVVHPTLTTPCLPCTGDFISGKMVFILNQTPGVPAVWEACCALYYSYLCSFSLPRCRSLPSSCRRWSCSRPRRTNTTWGSHESDDGTFGSILCTSQPPCPRIANIIYGWDHTGTLEYITLSLLCHFGLCELSHFFLFIVITWSNNLQPLPDPIINQFNWHMYALSDYIMSALLYVPMGHQLSFCLRDKSMALYKTDISIADALNISVFH